MKRSENTELSVSRTCFLSNACCLKYIYIYMYACMYIFPFLYFKILTPSLTLKTLCIFSYAK